MPCFGAESDIPVCILSLCIRKMPCWYFNRKELENTPSFCRGVDVAMEERYRREGVKLIIDAGGAIELYPLYIDC